MEAGLGAPSMRLSAPIGGAAAMQGWLHMFKELMATLLPQMQRLGIATPEELDLDTLVDRMLAEAQASTSIIVGHYQIGAWVRTPS